MPLTDPQIFSYNALVGPHVGSVRTSHSVIQPPLSNFQPYSFPLLTLYDDYILLCRWKQEAPQQCCHLSTTLHGIVSYKTV